MKEGLPHTPGPGAALQQPAANQSSSGARNAGSRCEVPDFSRIVTAGKLRGQEKMKLYLKLCNESLVSRPEYSFILFRRKNAAKYGSPDGWVYLQYPVQTIPISNPYPIQCLAKTFPNRVSSHGPYPPYILPFEFRFECLVGQGGDIGSLTDFDGTVADVEDCVDVLQKDVSEDTNPTS
jgi:hypothetical protein